MDAREDSTACRRAAAGLTCEGLLAAESEPVDESGERFLRRKLPAEINAAAEAGVGGCVCCVSAGWS